MLPIREAAPLLMVASVQDWTEAVLVVLGAQGVGPAPDAPRAELDAYLARAREVAGLLATEGWTKGEALTAARQLALSPELRDQIRYGRTLCAADFVAIKEGERGRIVRRQRLYAYPEALEAWKKAGEPGVFGETLTAPNPEAMFEPVVVEGRDKPMWRVK